MVLSGLIRTGLVLFLRSCSCLAGLPTHSSNLRSTTGSTVSWRKAVVHVLHGHQDDLPQALQQHHVQLGEVELQALVQEAHHLLGEGHHGVAQVHPAVVAGVLIEAADAAAAHLVLRRRRMGRLDVFDQQGLQAEGQVQADVGVHKHPHGRFGPHHEGGVAARVARKVHLKLLGRLQQAGEEDVAELVDVEQRGSFDAELPDGRLDRGRAVLQEQLAGLGGLACNADGNQSDRLRAERSGDNSNTRTSVSCRTRSSTFSRSSLTLWVTGWSLRYSLSLSSRSTAPSKSLWAMQTSRSSGSSWIQSRPRSTLSPAAGGSSSSWSKGLVDTSALAGDVGASSSSGLCRSLVTLFFLVSSRISSHSFLILLFSAWKMRLSGNMRILNMSFMGGLSFTLTTAKLSRSYRALYLYFTVPRRFGSQVAINRQSFMRNAWTFWMGDMLSASNSTRSPL
ncbi:hypothetical protein EYF80_040666 [Liparis tanakae]|uniref:Secreted protein n=1 Tax=Liparis tanakae TaxID=230148 RepID=A0A4Z2G8I7_9TELE|nr:hypothetical protein EYF80_040666 [Liparis tanakae]